jgi:hypothetical protein
MTVGYVLLGNNACRSRKMLVISLGTASAAPCTEEETAPLRLNRFMHERHSFVETTRSYADLDCASSIANRLCRNDSTILQA